MDVTRSEADAELMQRWQGGDPAAFEALVRRWQQPLGRFLARLADPPELAQDLCQEVFLRVYQAGPGYRESGAFATWLYRIALNVARDAGRKRRRTLLPLENAYAVQSSSWPLVECARRETAHLVAGAVAELPESLRLVLVLHHFEERNFE